MKRKSIGRKPSSALARRAAEIESRRAVLMARIGVARADAKVPETITTKAVALLTRHWASADWEAREGLLKAAEFLMTLPL